MSEVNKSSEEKSSVVEENIAVIPEEIQKNLRLGAGDVTPDDKSRDHDLTGVDSRQRDGYARFVNNFCPGTAYFRIFKGPDGQYGITNFTLRQGEEHEIFVQQYSTYCTACNSIPPNNCSRSYIYLSNR